MTNFVEEMRSLYKDENTFIKDLCSFLDKEKKLIVCRHNDCYSIGTVNDTHVHYVFNELYKRGHIDVLNNVKDALNTDLI